MDTGFKTDKDHAFTDLAQDYLFEVEANSWWFQYRARIITGLMKKYMDKSLTTVDVGGGNGYTSFVAKKKGYSMRILEPSEAACENAGKRGLEAQVGKVSEQYPEDGAFEQILLLDVLEHIEDDRGFLRLLYRKLRNGGCCIITVPAFNMLWSSVDDYTGHYRRYTRRLLRERALAAGFKPEFTSYFMSFLTLPLLLVNVLGEKLGLVKKHAEKTDEERLQLMKKQQDIKKGGLVDRVLKILEKAEYRHIMKGGKMPFGTSVVLVLRK